MPGEPFESPSGALLMYPVDPSAPAAEVINCQCQLTTRVMRPNERLVDGKVVQGLPSGGNGGKLKLDLQLFSFDPWKHKQIYLDKREYAMVMHEINTYLTDADIENGILSKAIGDYIYMVHVIDYDNYRIIGRESIERE